MDDTGNDMSECDHCLGEPEGENAGVNMNYVDSVVVEDGNGNAPKVGMKFSDENKLFEFYKRYACRLGFPVRRRNSKKGEDGNLRYVTYTCGREGRRNSAAGTLLKPKPTIQIGCKARLTACTEIGGAWRVNTVQLEHNHKTSPSKSRLFRCNREISGAVKRRLEINDVAGIPLHKSFNSAVVEVGGYDKLTCVERDCRNYIEKVRRLRLGEGDAAAIQAYFLKMQTKCPGFFFSMDLDEECRLRNVFWADYRCRQAYKEFGDVVTFDTTYLTNKYDMPFAPFVGVNHHGQSILFGCGLLSSEDTETFVWLFGIWRECMLDKAPIGIITDQDRAMQNAIEIVFPNTRHRWCLWHILKKLPEKFGYHVQKGSIMSSIHELVYESEGPHEFEQGWSTMLDMYSLQDHAWLTGLYQERSRWVPCFLKTTFWAGMSTTQRSESINAFFDGYVHSKTSLKQFVDQYERALRSKMEKEFQADFRSFSQMIPCATTYEMEKQFQKVYTLAKFKEFQEEFTGKVYCEVMSSQEGSLDMIYEVREHIFLGKTLKKKIFRVSHTVQTGHVSCSCKLFEFKGIVCRHAICVLIRNDIKNLPDTYVLRRWRRDIRRMYSRVPVDYDGWESSPGQKMYDQLCNTFAKIADLIAEDEVRSHSVIEWMESLLSDVSMGRARPNCGGKLLSHQFPAMGDECGNTNSRGSKSVLDPKCSRRKGAPRKLRMKGALERTSKRQKVAPTLKKCNMPVYSQPQNLHTNLQYNMLGPMSYSEQLLGIQAHPLSHAYGLNFIPTQGITTHFMPMYGQEDRTTHEDEIVSLQAITNETNANMSK